MVPLRCNDLRTNDGKGWTEDIPGMRMMIDISFDVPITTCATSLYSISLLDSISTANSYTTQPKKEDMQELTNSSYLFSCYFDLVTANADSAVCSNTSSASPSS